MGLLRRHVSKVEVSGLDIQIPPDRTRHADPSEHLAPESTGDRGGRDFVIDELHSENGQFVLIPSDPEKAPKVWAIHTLTMHSVGSDTAMPFQALSKNAIPPGDIAITRGSFGPWHASSQARLL